VRISLPTAKITANLQKIGHFGPLLALFGVRFISAFKRFDADSLLRREQGIPNA